MVILNIFPVIRGGHPSDFLELFGKMINIVISHFGRHLANRIILGLQQKLGLIHPFIQQILFGADMEN